MKKLLRFLWPALVLCLGFASYAAALWMMWSSFRTSGTVFTLPGEAVVSVSEPGTQTLWLVTRGLADGRMFTHDDELPGGVKIEVRRMENDEVVPLQATGKSRMSGSGEERVSMARIDFERSGDYRVIAEGLESERVFRLSASGFALRFFGGMMVILIGSVFLFAGVIWAIVVLVQILTERKR